MSAGPPPMTPELLDKAIIKAFDRFGLLCAWEIRKAIADEVATLTRAPSTVGVEAYEQCAKIADRAAAYVSTPQARSACEGIAASIRSASPTIASEARDGKVVQANSAASATECDHRSTEGAALAELSKLLERWREQRDYLRTLKSEGNLTRDWGELSDQQAIRRARELLASPHPESGDVRTATIEECAKAIEAMDFPAPRKNHRYQFDVKYKMVSAIRALSPSGEKRDLPDASNPGNHRAVRDSGASE